MDTKTDSLNELHLNLQSALSTWLNSSDLLIRLTEAQPEIEIKSTSTSLDDFSSALSEAAALVAAANSSENRDEGPRTSTHLKPYLAQFRAAESHSKSLISKLEGIHQVLSEIAEGSQKLVSSTDQCRDQAALRRAHRSLDRDPHSYRYRV